MKTLMEILLLVPRLGHPGGFFELLNSSREKYKLSCTVLVLSNRTLLSLRVLQGKKPLSHFMLSVYLCVHSKISYSSDPSLKIDCKLIEKNSSSLNVLFSSMHSFFSIFLYFLHCIHNAVKNQGT